MTKKPERNLTVEATHIYSLDRCIECLAALNLGDNCFCKVVMKTGKQAESDGDDCPD